MPALKSVEICQSSYCHEAKILNIAPLDTLSSHGSALKTVVRELSVRIQHSFALYTTGLPQNPVSKPTEKQLFSLLKEDEIEKGPTDSSITCRVFILTAAILKQSLGPLMYTTNDGISMRELEQGERLEG